MWILIHRILCYLVQGYIKWLAEVGFEQGQSDNKNCVSNHSAVPSLDVLPGITPENALDQSE